MSLNHVIEGGDPETKINIGVTDIAPTGDLVITCDNGEQFNLKPPILGTPGLVLKSDGAGNTYWGNDVGGSAGVNYEGTLPCQIGRFATYSNTLGTEIVDAGMRQDGTDLILDNLDVQSAGLYNNTYVFDGTIESRGTRDIDINTSDPAGLVNVYKTLSMQDNKIINVLDPTLTTDAATKNYVDTTVGAIAASAVVYSGPPTTGQELLITNIPTGPGVTATAATGITYDGASLSMNNKNIIDVNGLAINSITNFASGTIFCDSNININSKKILNLADPTSAQEAATKAYVDANAGGGGGVANPLTADLDCGNFSLNNINTIRTGQIIDNGTGTVIFNSNMNLLTKDIVNASNITATASVTTGSLSVTSMTSSNSEILMNRGLDMQGFSKITNLANPTAGGDAANRTYVDSKPNPLNLGGYEMLPLSIANTFYNGTGVTYFFQIRAEGSFYLTKANLTKGKTSTGSAYISFYRGELANQASVSLISLPTNNAAGVNGTNTLEINFGTSIVLSKSENIIVAIYTPVNGAFLLGYGSGLQNTEFAGTTNSLNIPANGFPSDLSTVTLTPTNVRLCCTLG